MWFYDDDVFNPFMIGPPENAKRHEYKQPDYVTYPPYAVWSKEHFNKSVSKGTILAEEERKRELNRKKEESCTKSKSQLGEVGFSKAINEEMAAAKRSTNEERIHAGGASKTGLFNSGSKVSLGSGSVRTLMSVRSQRSTSQASQVPSQMSTAKSISSRVKAGDRQSSKLSMRSHVSKRTDSNVTLKKPKQPIHRDLDTDVYNDASHASLRSKTREHSGDGTSHRSVRSENRLDKVSCVSRDSPRSQASVNQSRTSTVRPKDDNHHKNTNSQVSMRSKTTERQTENVSRISHVGDEKKADNVSIHSKSKSLSKTMPSLKEVAESIQRELAQSLETTKSLSIKAAELSERLKAGNEFNHNRYQTQNRQCIQTEPLKRNREDRMAHWFKDAVLS